MEILTVKRYEEDDLTITNDPDEDDDDPDIDIDIDIPDGGGCDGCPGGGDPTGGNPGGGDPGDGTPPTTNDDDQKSPIDKTPPDIKQNTQKSSKKGKAGNITNNNSNIANEVDSGPTAADGSTPRTDRVATLGTDYSQLYEGVHGAKGIHDPLDPQDAYPNLMDEGNAQKKTSKPWIYYGLYKTP